MEQTIKKMKKQDRIFIKVYLLILAMVAYTCSYGQTIDKAVEDIIDAKIAHHLSLQTGEIDVMVRAIMDEKLIQSNYLIYQIDSLINFALDKRDITTIISDETTPTNTTLEDINQRPTVRITVPTDQTQYMVGESIPIRIEANDPDGSIIQYKVYFNDKLIDTDGPLFTPPNFIGALGENKIRVVVTDDDHETFGATTTITITQ